MVQFGSVWFLSKGSHVDIMICFQMELKTQFFYKKAQSKVEKAREDVQAALAKKTGPKGKTLGKLD